MILLKNPVGQHERYLSQKETQIIQDSARGKMQSTPYFSDGSQKGYSNQRTSKGR